MKKVVVSGLLSLLLTSLVAAEEFSADMVMKSKEGNMEGKLFAKENLFRMDMQAAQMKMTTIVRTDKKLVWSLMSDAKMYMEMPLQPHYKPRVEEKMDGEVERKEAGKETIDGHPATKYLITVKNEKGTEQIYQWLATDIKFPIKSAAADGSWTQEFKNIKKEKQADSLFEIPAGYTKMDMPNMSQMMQNSKGSSK